MKDQNKIKFKFISSEFEWETKWLDEEFKRIANPLPYNNLPDGEYIIRGSRKGQRKVYWKNKDIWYFVEDVKKDNGHYYTDSTRYMLFPMLSEKEWNTIQSVGWKKLNLNWQRHLYGYFHWKELLKLRFETKLSMYKWDKWDKENPNITF